MECGVELPFERVLLQPGDLVAGRYLILNLLGRGGMGVVAEVEDQEDKQRYALKTLGAEALEQPLWRARFRQEARALSQFHSPHIQRLHRYFEDDGQPYMLMEYVDGTDLQKLLEHCIRLPPESAQQRTGRSLRKHSGFCKSSPPSTATGFPFDSPANSGGAEHSRLCGDRAVNVVGWCLRSGNTILFQPLPSFV